MALDVGVFSNLRPVQAPDLLGPYSTMMNLQTMKLQQQDIQQQTAERQQIARQRQLENQEVSDIGGYVQQQIQKGGKLDDEDFLNGLMRYPRFGAKMRAELEGIKKTRAETAAAQAATQKTQAETQKTQAETQKTQAEIPTIGQKVESTGVYDFGSKTFNRFPQTPLQEAQTDEASAKAREARADAAMKELQTGNFPQTLDAALSQAGAIAPNDKTFGELNTRYTGMLKNGPQNPAAWAATLKQLGEEAKSVSTAKATVPFKVEVQQAQANAMTPDARRLLGEQVLNGMTPPRVLAGAAYTAAAERAKELGLSAQAAVMEQRAAKANTEALNTITQRLSQITVFSNTANAHMGTLTKTMAAVSDLGAPVLNTPLRDLQSKFGGNPKVTAFYTAMLPVQTEIAKALNGAMGSGVLTDSAREEIRPALSPGATVGQLKAALDTLQEDMSQQKRVYEAQQQDLLRTSVVGAPSATPAPAVKPGFSIVR